MFHILLWLNIYVIYVPYFLTLLTPDAFSLPTCKTKLAVDMAGYDAF